MKRELVLSLILLGSLALSGTVSAEVPNVISYQGRLTTPAGEAVPDGSYQMTFIIWDALAGGSAIWNSGIQSVTVEEGLFSVALGAAPMPPIPPAIWWDTSRYLGVTIGTDPELAPRTRLTSGFSSYMSTYATYAYHATHADTASRAASVATVDGATGGTISGFTLITNPQAGYGNVLSLASNATGAYLDIIPQTGGTGVVNVNRIDASLALAIANNRHMTISNSGNVGIGTTSPTTKLDVAGSVKIADGTQGSGKVLTSDANGLASWQTAAGGGIGGSGTTNYLPKFTASTTLGNSLVYESAGRIGIGTVSPNEQLEITGNLRLPLSTASAGVIKLGGSTFMHNFGSNNTFIGLAAGNLSMTGGNNTACGQQALYLNTTGSDNTACGNLALASNTTGRDNTATGHRALALNTTGVNNTAGGSEALWHNTSGNQNTAYGNLTLTENTTGNDNTATGNQALGLNTIGTGNTANGHMALYHNTSASNNTACGYYALLTNTTGGANTAAGVAALRNNTTGSANAATGYGALWQNTTGIQNTAVGDIALYTNTTGSNNTAIGQGADVSGNNLSNATAIGYGAIVNASNKIRLGNTAVTVICGQVAFTACSDRNLKEMFLPVNGEEILRKIRGLSLTSWNYKGHDPKLFRHYGPVAQEFFDAFGHDGVGQCGDSTTINSGDMAGILMIAVQALEKRTLEIEAVKAESEKLRSEVDNLKSMVNQLLAQSKQSVTSYSAR